MINPNNLETMKIPVYTEEQINQMLTKEDLEEFLILMGYEKDDEK